MKHSALFALAAFALAGCGGTIVNSAPVSPYEGAFTGTFANTEAGVTGTLSLDVTNDGTVTGVSVLNLTEGTATGQVRGSIARTGAFSGTVQYPEEPAQALNGTLELVGNRITGTLAQTTPSGPVLVTVSLDRVVVGG